MRNRRVSCTHPMHFFFFFFPFGIIPNKRRGTVVERCRTFPRNLVRTPAGAEENWQTPWDSNPRPPRSTLLSLEEKFARGDQERRGRVIACIHSWVKRYDGMETKTCVIRVQFMAHFAIQQKGVRVYISFTCTHPYMSRPQTSFGRRSWLRCGED